MTDQDPTPPPVVLQEPKRPPRPVDPAGPGYELIPEEPPRYDLHPGWQGVLAPHETALWSGQPTSDPRLGPFAALLAQPFIAIPLGLFLMLAVVSASGTRMPIELIWLGLVVWIFLPRKKRRPMSRIYLLTDRAAYLARPAGTRLLDVTAYPITADMQLGLGPRSVSFAMRRDRKGRIEAEGFLDISDARRVHDMIRDLQKGLT